MQIFYRSLATALLITIVSVTFFFTSARFGLGIISHTVRALFWTSTICIAVGTLLGFALIWSFDLASFVLATQRNTGAPFGFWLKVFSTFQDFGVMSTVLFLLNARLESGSASETTSFNCQVCNFIFPLLSVLEFIDLWFGPLSDFYKKTATTLILFIGLLLLNIIISNSLKSFEEKAAAIDTTASEKPPVI